MPLQIFSSGLKPREELVSFGFHTSISTSFNKDSTAPPSPRSPVNTLEGSRRRCDQHAPPWVSGVRQYRQLLQAALIRPARRCSWPDKRTHTCPLHGAPVKGSVGDRTQPGTYKSKKASVTYGGGYLTLQSRTAGALNCCGVCVCVFSLSLTSELHLAQSSRLNGLKRTQGVSISKGVGRQAAQLDAHHRAGVRLLLKRLRLQ